MSDDLNRLLKAQIEKDVRQRPRPDLAAVVRRGQRRRALTWMATSVAVVIVVAGVVPAVRYIVNESSVSPAWERDRIEGGPTPGSWQPVGEPTFQPVPSTSKGIVRVGAPLSWEGPIEGALPTECEVRVLGDAGVVGTATATVPPPDKALPGGAVPGYDLYVRVQVPTDDMGVDSTVRCAPAATDDSSETNNCPESRGGDGWTSPEVLVAAGTHKGNNWVLCARTARNDRTRSGSEGLCMNFAYGTSRGSGLDCAYTFFSGSAKPVPLDADYFSPIWGPEVGFFYGAVPAAAERTEFESDTGTTTQGDIHPPPDALGVPFSFFTLFSEPETGGTLIITDSEGDVIAKRRMDPEV